MIIGCKYLFIPPFIFSSVFADWEKLYRHQGEHTLEKGKILHKIPTFPKEWKVSFELKPTSFVAGTRNALHVGDHKPFGENMAYADNPTINIVTNSNLQGSMRIFFHVNGEIRHRDTQIPQLNQWTKIEVSQLLDAGGQYRLTVVVNGAKVGSDINLSPKEFMDVNVYASAPLYRAQLGKIRNLVISSPQRRPGDINIIVLCNIAKILPSLSFSNHNVGNRHYRSYNSSRN